MTPPSSLDVARDAYRAISLYAPNREPARIDVSDNTNLWGVPPAAERAVREVGTSTVTRYPSLYAPQLKAALADYLGVEPSMIVTGCGSDDVLDSAIRAFAEPGDRVAVPAPSFAMIPIFARMNGVEPVTVALTGACDVDADAMLATEARIIYLCSPNNPTGNALSRAAVERIVREAPGVVIVDEAYAEFSAAPSAVDFLGAHERLLVSRTMSKAFGLAGLRVGYAAGAPALVAEVEKSRGPYKINALAERAAVAALRDDMAWVRDHVAEAVANRERLSGELRALGLAPVPSEANFVLAPTPRGVALARRMRELGVAVRAFDDLGRDVPAFREAGGQGLRISVGPWAAMAETLAVLQTALGEL
jgi:histidinol-phosphate aminotransferase